MNETIRTEQEREIQVAIEQRIEEMESGDYQFPKRLVKADYIIVSVVAVICLAIVVVGASL
jgi:hypothetical protein